MSGSNKRHPCPAIEHLIHFLYIKKNRWVKKSLRLFLVCPRNGVKTIYVCFNVKLTLLVRGILEGKAAFKLGL